jgi:hypothetical protein
MSENVGASTSRNPKGLHSLDRNNFTFFMGKFQATTFIRSDQKNEKRHTQSQVLQFIAEEGTVAPPSKLPWLQSRNSGATTKDGPQVQQQIRTGRGFTSSYVNPGNPIAAALWGDKQMHHAFGELMESFPSSLRGAQKV